MGYLTSAHSAYPQSAQTCCRSWAPTARMAPMMALIAKGASLKSAARQCGIPYSSAQEHVAKLRRGGAKA